MRFIFATGFVYFAICSTVLAQNDVDALQNFKAKLQQLSDDDHAVGIEIYITQGERQLLHETFGWQDRNKQTKMRKNAIYNIRSMTKPMGGTIVQKLIDQGKLKLDDPVSKFLPSFNNEKSRDITIEQCLLHRAGYEQGPPGRPWRTYGKLIDVADYWGKTGPTLPVGKQWSYADAHADIVAAVAEKVTAKSAKELLNEYIFQPLDLKHTFAAWTDDKKIIEQIAPLYRGSKGNWNRIWIPSDGALYPFTMYSQSVYSNVQDYSKYIRNYMSGRTNAIVSSKGIQRSFANRQAVNLPPGFFPIGEGKRLCYGHLWGFAIDPDSKSDQPYVIMHTGSDGTASYAFPDLDLVIIVMTQSRGTGVLPMIETAINKHLLPQVK
ncbi:MAG: serine hydrolase domain-containing protein [Planctomycetota bacterium]